MSEMYELYLKYKGRKVDDKFFETALGIFLKKDESLKPFINDFNVIDYKDDNYFGTYKNEQRELSYRC